MPVTRNHMGSGAYVIQGDDRRIRTLPRARHPLHAANSPTAVKVSSAPHLVSQPCQWFKNPHLCTLNSGRTENDGIGRALRKLRGTTESVSPPLSRATGGP
ncbi:hypothetical protein BD309DRAFT_971062, partial [Dichomitus squalens]